MKILELDYLKIESQIDFVVSELKKSKIIALPTDTCYGLSTVISPESVDKIYKIKQRSKDKPLSIFIRKNWANDYMELNNQGQKLINRFWPGGLTLISSVKKDKIDFLDPVASESSKVAFREPNFDLIIRILNELGSPITATSANISNKPEIFSPKDVLKQFTSQKYRPDYLIDAGNLPKRKTSTIIEQDTLKILRKGEIKEDVVVRFLNS